MSLALPLRVSFVKRASVLGHGSIHDRLRVAVGTRSLSDPGRGGLSAGAFRRCLLLAAGTNSPVPRAASGQLGALSSGAVVMADDGKRTELACTKVTERMMLDLARLAAVDDRSLSDFMYRLIRQRLYGDVARLSTDGRSTTSNKVDHEQ